MKHTFKKKVSPSITQKVSSWVNGATCVKAGRGLVNLFIKQVVIVSSLTSARVRSLVLFAKFVYKLGNKQGNKGLVLTLKSCSVSLMQSVGGQVTKDMGTFGPRFSRTKGGLPRIIPRLDREKIRSGETRTIRLWLSLFSIYRLIEFAGKLKLTTITDPPKAFDLNQFIGLSEVYFRAFGLRSLKFADQPRVFPIYSTGSTQIFEKEKSSTSFRGVVQGAIALCARPDLMDYFLSIDPEQHLVKWIDHFNDRYINDERFLDSQKAPLGALACLDEPAGKIRVVAMVECWTQWLLKSLHDSIFAVLKQLPTDGTMDQLKPIHRLLAKGYTSFWCYDLSAATDRLPISIQVEVLVPFIGRERAEAWRGLLVERDYLLAREHGTGPRETRRISRTNLRYAAGQPMGALSSWAMLAITHHILVALAARRVGIPFGLFTAYALLGDDIVIANGRVARSYLALMKEIGVDISTAKSLISRKGVLEFAKRFIVCGVDCSPVSLREIMTSIETMQGRVELGKKYSLTLPQLVTVSGWGFKTKGWLTKPISSCSNRVRRLGLLFYSPWGVVPLPDLNWFSLRSFIFSFENLVVDHSVIELRHVLLDTWRTTLKTKIRLHPVQIGLKNYGDPLIVLKYSIIEWFETRFKILGFVISQEKELVRFWSAMWWETWDSNLESLKSARSGLTWGPQTGDPFTMDHPVMWPTPDFETMMSYDRMLSCISRDVKDMLWLKKPTLRDREVSKAFRFWDRVDLLKTLYSLEFLGTLATKKVNGQADSDLPINL